MKQFFPLLLFLGMALCPVFSQHNNLDGFIDKYKNDRAFTYAFLSREMFEVVTEHKTDDKDWQKLRNVVRNIGSLTILVADSIGTARELYNEALPLVPADTYDALLTVRDGDDKVHIWVQDENDALTGLILLVGSEEEFVLICFAGTLELSSFGDLASLFNAGESAHLAQASKDLSIDFSVSPNPSQGEITLVYSDEQDPPAQLTVIGQDGRVVKTLELSGDASQRVLLRGVPAGAYWLQMKTRSGKVGVKQLQIAGP
ncbi:MAG: DUF4252 domain-containing protein [Saprospiraceae bacterium]